MAKAQKSNNNLKHLRRSDQLAGRIGKEFELGNPHIYNNGLRYAWHSKNTDEFESSFNKRKEELGNFLLERSKGYIKDFGVFTQSPYPHLQIRDGGFAIHIGTGGRWADFSPGLGGAMANLHNMDSYREQVLGFNLAADMLELLDAQIKAPRITKRYDIIYPLPQDLKVIPFQDNPVFSEEWINEWSARIAMLGKVKKIKAEGSTQEFIFNDGKITVRQGSCIGSGFSGFSIAGATTLIAKLVDSCGFVKTKS